MTIKVTGEKTCSRSSGFTLVELLIVMVLFMGVIMISTSAFNTILTSAKQQMKSSEGNVQGIVGLEIFKSDLESAGYGLPWQLGFVGNWDESTVADNNLANGIKPTDYNDKNNASDDPNKVPRGIQSGTASGAAEWENGRDYLVVKSTSVGMNATSKKWSYINGFDTSSSIKEWGSDDLVEKDRVVTLDSKNRRLIAVSASDFSYIVPAKNGGVFEPPVGYRPLQDTDVYLVYGIGYWNDTSTTLRVPYNRVDYYIKRPTSGDDISTRCAPGTGILYKSDLNHSDGKVTRYPLLDCIADMQVVYALDTNADGGVDFHGNEDELNLLSAETIRKRLKEIRVYILTHEGQKDNSFSYTGGSTIQVGEFGKGRLYDLSKLENIGTSWKNYRWKIYTIVVIPKNINY
jgi:type II secretory pathway pseudopilin PulG